MTAQEGRAAVEAAGGVRAAAKALRMSRATLYRVLRGEGGDVKRPAGGGAVAAAKGAAGMEEKAKAAGRSLSEFRATYDKDTIIPGKVRAALRLLGCGWDYEVQFAKLAGVSLADLGNYRDQFADHVVTLRESRRAWAGTVATAKAMKGML